MSGRLARLDACSPKEKDDALAFLSGYSPDAFDCCMLHVERFRKPPRIPEPGLWGVVEAKSRPGQAFPSRYVRRYDQGNAGYDWVTVNSAESSQSLRWSDLIDPVLVREGLS